MFRTPSITHTWKRANIPFIEFTEKYKDKLSRTTFGCTLSTKRWVDRAEGLSIKDGVAFLKSELGIVDIRSDIRWAHVEHNQGHIDLSTYSPVLDELFGDADFNISLNIGPIKTVGWPEEHPPQWLNQLPPANTWIQADSEIAQKSYEYLHQICQKLHLYYGSKFDHLHSIQLNNEPHNPMGAKKWKMSDEYSMRVIEICREYFPEANHLFNSAGRFQTRSLTRIIRKAQQKYPDIKTTLGYDHYYANGEYSHIPFVTSFDSFNLGRPFTDWTMRKTLQFCKDHNIQFEITEAQLEPWGKMRRPGNSVIDLQFMLLRIWDHCLLEPNETVMIKLWGVERLITRILRNNAYQEHADIVSLIQATGKL